MFSNTSLPASTTSRNPRRRQRTGSDDSVAVRQPPKRLKRSGLTAETFKPPVTYSANGHRNKAEASPAVNGYVRDTRSQSPAGRENTSLAIRNRGGRRSERERKSDRSSGNVELTKNDTYAVGRLATTPLQLQEQGNAAKWHGEFAPSLGYAIATTRTQALIWRYKPGPNPHDSSKPIIVQLLHVADGPDDPLPLGVLIPSSPEPGLLIVMPTSGKATYWETLSSAASVDRGRQQQQAVQGTVIALASGEHITNIVEAEPLGFLITISSGKIVHLTIADPQGKAKISTQLLRSSVSETSGIFSSLRNVFGGASWLRDVAAVKVTKSGHNARRQCVIGTTKGALQVWDLHWNGVHSLNYELDAKSRLLESIRDTGTFPRDSDHQYFKVLDFAFLPPVVTGQEVTSSASSPATRILFLTVISSPTTARYNLHVGNITPGEIDIPIVHPLNCYQTLPDSTSSPIAHVLVPEPGQTAYVIFDTSVVLVSLEEIEESPDSQLQTEARRVPDPFQDVVDFHKGKGFTVVGCAVDVPGKGQDGSACTIMVQGYGVIRVSVAPVEEGLTSADRTAITAVTKLEQAVFYGSQQSLLDLSGRSEIQFATEEVRDAALRISRSITSSSSSHLSTAGPSIGQHLQKRAIALVDLIKHLRKHYPPLDYVTRWQLLWEAEKMAAARAIWQVYSDHFSHRHEFEGEKILLYELIESISEKHKIENRPAHYETDHVRHWFIKDVWRLELIVPWAYRALDTLYRESVEDDRPMSSAAHGRLISQAYDLQLSSLETAYSFRQSNASLYGFDEDIMVEGLPARDYKDLGDLPESWTASDWIWPAVGQLSEYFQKFAGDSASSSSDEEGEGPPQDMLMMIAEKNARLIDIICKTHTERWQLLQARHDPATRKQGKDIERKFAVQRKSILKGLAEMGQLSAAIELGEKYKDMDALADVLDSENLESQEMLSDVVKSGESGEKLEILRDKIALCESYVNEYFDKYGTAWANAFFIRFVASNRIARLLAFGRKQRHHLTTFLRNHPECSNFSWINEVSSEGGYASAAKCLRAATKQADTVWAKKIQMSISKLASLAVDPGKQKEDNNAEPFLRTVDGRLEVLASQEQLYDYLLPTLRTALNDTPARIDVVMEQHGKRFVKGKPALRKAMKLHVAKLVEEKVLDTEDLVDTISLMDEDSLDPDSDFTIRRFLKALELVQLEAMDTGEMARKDLQERIVWRRCIIQDDWPKINRTESKDEAQVKKETQVTTLFKTLMEGFKSGMVVLFRIIPPLMVLTLDADFWRDNPPPEPSTLLGAGATVESLRTSSRYKDAPDSALSLIARDLETEDRALQRCIEKGRLEEWWKGIIDAARASARSEADRIGEEESRRSEAEEGFREQMRRDDRAAWGVNGVDGVAGTGDAGPGDAGREGGAMDEDGDVSMGM
ncbi:MAG: hypothetical protein Q9223_003041 [Gallowayella weberi]